MDYERCGDRRTGPYRSEGEREVWHWLAILYGRPIKNHKPQEVLTEWEEVQLDYDDLHWQRYGYKHFRANNGCSCCQSYETPFAAQLTKPKYLNFRDNVSDNNAKRKTIRTHRSGSRRLFNIRQKAV